MTTSTENILSGLPAALSTKLTQLPAYQLARIATPPEQGKGHRELFRDACVLHRHRFTADEIEQVLRARFWGYYHEIPDRDFEEAIRNASGAPSTPRQPRWPDAQPALIAVVLKGEGSVGQLESSSPVKEPWELETGDVLDRFFGDQDILCMGTTASCWVTKPRSWFRGKEHSYQFVVPNPLSALSGLKNDGTPSSRCNSNAGPWLTQVIEFDTGTLDEQAKIHLKLQASGATLRMVVFSGGKSLHGWYDVRGWPPEKLREFRWYASVLGADDATFPACQFVRAPNARRENGQIQHVLFLA